MKTADYVAIGVKREHAKHLWLAFTAEPHVLADLDGNSADFVDPKYEALARTIMSTGDEVAALKAEIDGERKKSKRVGIQ
jgi:hypothetical protein